MQLVRRQMHSSSRLPAERDGHRPANRCQPATPTHALGGLVELLRGAPESGGELAMRRCRRPGRRGYPAMAAGSSIGSRLLSDALRPWVDSLYLR